MHSNILIFNMNLPTYGIIALFDIIFISIIGIIIVTFNRLKIKHFLIIELYGGGSAIIGAKIWNMIFSQWNVSYALFVHSGLSSYGGIFFGIIGIYIASKIYNIIIDDYKQQLIFLVPLFHGIWKIGCFMGGCCYGIKYNGPGAVIYPIGINESAGISVFPIQLLEAFILFALAVFFYIEKYKIKHFITLYISLYSISRFFTDFLRWHKTKQILTTTQIISLICIFLIILLTERIKLYEKNN